VAAKPKLIKVCLTNQGEDTETPWAYDLGAVPGGRKVRLANVPFMHAKPTWGDTIVVANSDDGLPTWDRDGVAWSDVATRILEDGGHWAMIVDYAPHGSGADSFAALARACGEHDFACEGAWAPSEGKPGRAYLAVPNALADGDVMEALRAASLPCELVQIHPAPIAPPAKKRVAKRPAATKKSPAKPAPTKGRPKKRATKARR
jgi:hypothetical protein